jgi:hypothetical protein
MVRLSFLRLVRLTTDQANHAIIKVPGRVDFKMDIRSIDNDMLLKLDQDLRAEVERISAKRNITVDLGDVGNAFDDDLPYYHRFADGQEPLLILPYVLDCNDMKYFHPNGFVTMDEFIRYVRDGVGVLLAEGERGHPKMLNIDLHLRISGRPSRFAGVQGILEYLSGLGDEVWTATRQEIGRCFRAQFPPLENGGGNGKFGVRSD